MSVGEITLLRNDIDLDFVKALGADQPGGLSFFRGLLKERLTSGVFQGWRLGVFDLAADWFAVPEWHIINTPTPRAQGGDDK